MDHSARLDRPYHGDPDIQAADLQAIAESFRQSVRDFEIAHIGSEKGLVTVSIGVSLMDAHSDLRGPADFLRLADQGLYRAKGAGRDCVRSMEMPVAQANAVPAAKFS